MCSINHSSHQPQKRKYRNSHYCSSGEYLTSSNGKCGIFSIRKLAQQRNAGKYRVPDLVRLDLVQITDIPELVSVHLWLDQTIITGECALARNVYSPIPLYSHHTLQVSNQLY